MISSERDTRITLTAQAKGIGALGTRIIIIIFLSIIIIIPYLSRMRSAFPILFALCFTSVASRSSNLHTNHFIAACSVKISGWTSSASLFQ